MTTNVRQEALGLEDFVLLALNQRGVALTKADLRQPADRVISAITEAGLQKAPVGIGVVRALAALLQFYTTVLAEPFSAQDYGSACFELASAKSFLVTAHMEMFDLAAAGDKRRYASKVGSAKGAATKRRDKAERAQIIADLLKTGVPKKRVPVHLVGKLNESKSKMHIPSARVIEDEVRAVHDQFKKNRLN